MAAGAFIVRFSLWRQKQRPAACEFTRPAESIVMFSPKTPEASAPDTHLRLGGGPGAFIDYSPYGVARVLAGVKCVTVNEALKDIEPMAWDFVMNFARDNDLQVSDACLLPEQPRK